MGWIRKKVTEPTTWAGVGMAVATFAAHGFVFTPDVVALLLGAFGLVKVNETPAS